MASSHGVEPAAKRARNVQHAAASSRSESAEQPATSVPSEPPAKRARNVQHDAASSGSGSAEQPATSVPSEPAAKRARNVQPAAASSGSGSAEQPATSVPSAQSIAFITCAASSQDYTLARPQKTIRSQDYTLARLQLTVHKALEAGATIVNIAFATSIARDLVDPDAILPQLRSVFDATWTGSVGQPAYVVRNIGSVMSFFLCSGATLLSETILDPEGCLPALMLTFSAPEGRLCMIISSVPNLPMRARARILNCYVDAAMDTQAKNILIGGHWQGSPFYMKNIVAKQKMPFEFFTNERLCLLAHAPDCAPVRCFPLDTAGPYSFMGVWDSFSSVEQPARCNLAPEVWMRVAAFVGSHQPLVLCPRVWTPKRHYLWTPKRTLWTPKRHYRRCGQSCPCCRAEHAEILGACDACSDLWEMKCVSTQFKILLQAFGKQC